MIHVSIESRGNVQSFLWLFEHVDTFIITFNILAYKYYYLYNFGSVIIVLFLFSL